MSSCGTLGTLCSQRGLPDSLPHSTPSVSGSPGLSFLPGESGEVPSPSGRGGGHVNQGGHRRNLGLRPGFLQQAISSSESLGSLETRSRRLQAKRVRFKDKIFHGDHPVSPELHSEGRLDDLHGYERRLFPHSNSPNFEKIPEVLLQLEDVPVPSAVLWPKHSSASLHQGSGSSSKDIAFSRFSNTPLLGRLASDSKVSGRCAESQDIRPKPSTGARDLNQPRKVVFSSNPSYRILGHGNRQPSFLGFPHDETYRFRSVNLKRISLLSRKASKVLAEPARVFIFSREIHSRGETQDETPAISPESDMGQSLTTHSHSNSSRSEGVSFMVGRTGENNQGTLPNQKEPRPTVILRRLPGRLGSHNREPPPVRKMVSFGETRTHQYPGTQSYLVSSERSPPSSPRENRCCILGQYNSPVVYSETGGNQVLDAVSLSTRDFSLAGGTPHLSNSPVYPRLQEYSSGFSEQERAGPSHRVDTACGRLPEDLDMVGSSDGGSICHQSDKETPTIHVSSLRPIGNSDGRHVAKLVQRGRLCVPSIRHDKECDQQVSTESQLQTDPNSTMVASEGMVPRSTESSDGTTKVSATQTGPSEPTTSKGKAQKSPHASTNRMETMLRLMKHKDLSSKVSRSIYDSRKSSTNVLYQKRWATFVSWCRANKYSASRPTITSLCEFFIYLFEEKGLVVNTIRCYRSTLHSVLRHTGLKINKNQDVADVIRSLRLRAPVNNSRLVNWNLDVLLKFLCSDTFEPISHCSLLNLTRKTFILLALALSKRVSELQALSRTVGFCTEGALVSLSLDFRAKNDFKCKDLERHFLIKELGSLVGQEEEALLCPVRALKTYLERTNNLVGPNMGRLFVSPRKPTNPASKNALTSMTKDVIREAHVALCPDLLPILKVKTHELRGVSTTMAFNKNLSLQAVMEAAQWRCNSVFASHYLKDIALTYEDCRTLGPLLVAVTVIT